MGIVKEQGIANTALVYVGTLVGAVSLLFVQPVFLTKDELGLARLILSFATVLSSLLSFGISSVTVRYLPRLFDQQQGHRGFLGFVVLYLSVSITLGLLALHLLRGPLIALYGDETGVFSEHYGFVVLLSVSYSFVLGFNSYCMALMRSIFPTFLNDIVVRLLFITIILLHFNGILDPDQFLLAFCLTYSVQALVLFIYANVSGSPSLIPDIGHMRREIGLRAMLRYGAIITFTTINSVTLKYLDSIFVGRISLEQVAVYSVAAFIGLMIEVPLNAIERIANPAISHALAANDMSTISTIYHRSARFLLLIGGWMFIMVALNVHDLLQLLPKGYSAGAPVAVVIALGALINMITGINYPILANSDRYIYGSVFLVVLLALTILGNWLLIPHYGMMGAAITTCVANVVYNAMKFEFIRRRYGLQPFDRITFRTAAIIALLAGIFAFVPLHFGPWVNIVARFVIVSALFFGCALKAGSLRGLEGYLPTALRERLNIGA